MKKYKSNLYGTLQEPENFIEIMELIQQDIHRDTKRIMYWRGQSDITWPIHSGAYRKLFKEKGKVSYHDINWHERELLQKAKHRGFGLEDGKVLSDFALLAKLQHHGAATRLVDFSKNALIALWFCVSSVPEKMGVLIGIDSNSLGGDLEEMDHNPNQTYEEFITVLSNIDAPLFKEPTAISPRVSAQHSVFLYSDIETVDERGSLKLPKIKNDFIAIPISLELKQECKNILKRCFDIRYMTLFPDLNGFCKGNGID